MGRSRGSKKGKVFNLFKTDFTISFFHKPTDGEDPYHYIVLNDSVRLRIRLGPNILIIDEVCPLTMTNLDRLYQKIITFLKDQTEFSVLLDNSGCIWPITQTAISLGFPLVEDASCSHMGETAYQAYRNYCKNDLAKCGLFLIAVNEIGESDGDPKEVEPVQEEEITPVKEEKPIIVVTPEEEPDEDEELEQEPDPIFEVISEMESNGFIKMMLYRDMDSGKDAECKTPNGTITMSVYFDNNDPNVFIHHLHMRDFDFVDCQNFIKTVVSLTRLILPGGSVYIVGVDPRSTIDQNLLHVYNGPVLEDIQFGRITLPNFLMTVSPGIIYRVKNTITPV